MIIYINILLLLCGFSALFLGVSFLKKERVTKTVFKYIVALLSVSTSMVCVGYAVMSLSPDLFVAYIFRNVGLIGILLYLISEIFLVVNDINVPFAFKHTVYILVPVTALADIVVFSFPRANTYVRYQNYTSYIANETWRHNVHYIYLAVLSAFMLVIAIIWAVQVKLKREKLFVAAAFISNFFLLFSALPDAFSLKFALKYPHVPYSVGIVVAFAFFYVAAVQYSAFFITVDSVSDDIFTNVTTGLAVFDSDGKLSLLNKYASGFLGLKYDHSLELKDLFKVSDDFAKRALNKAIIDNFDRYRLVARNTDKSCLVNLSSKLDRAGEPIFFLAIISDLTEENRLIEEAQAANEAKTAFLSNISHEIRTPINTITGMSEMIIRECEDLDITKYASNIESASRALLGLVNDVLDFSKIESGRYQILPVRYQVKALLSDIYKTAYPRAYDKGQEFTITVDPSMPSELYGDDVRIRQIALNLITNAIKYTQNYGRININVGFENRDNRDCLLISVTDNGIGIKEEDIPMLFKSFVRLDIEKNRAVEGTGLGLSIVKRLLDAMEGTVSVESSYGEGSSFFVCLPQQIAEGEPIGELDLSFERILSKSEAHHYAEFNATGANILVVDDSPMNIEVMVGLLKDTNINVDTSEDGYDALGKIRRNHYDIIFLDHMMPGLSGIDVLKKMQEIEDYPNKEAPVVMLTANAVSGVDKDYFNIGFSDYIPKPIDPVMLEKVILKYLPKEKVKLGKKKRASKKNTLPEELYTFLDVKSGLDHSAGEVSFYISLLKKYVEEDKREKLTKALENREFDKYQIAVHSLKGTSLTIGATELSVNAKALEAAAKEENEAFIKENHDLLIKEYSELLSKISSSLNI